jgi:hypothetical protein
MSKVETGLFRVSISVRTVEAFTKGCTRYLTEPVGYARQEYDGHPQTPS